MATIDANTTLKSIAEVSVGDDVPPLDRLMTPVHLMRWSAASENFHRIHYDLPFAVEHEKLPGVLVNGSWKQHFLVQMMRHWLEPVGWLAKISFEFRAMDVAPTTLTAWGTVVDTYETSEFGVVICEIGIRNENGRQSTPGMAMGALPLRVGERLPYPFPGLPERS